MAKYKTYTCKSCSKEFESNKGCKSRTPKFCSRVCSNSFMTPEKRQKQSSAKKGLTPWNKGIEMWKDKDHPRGTLGKTGLRTGYKHSEETIEKLKVSHLGKKLPWTSRQNHWNWQGGITSENDRIRQSSDYKLWRNKVFTRDDYTCQMCNVRGGTLHADHIKPFSLFPELRLDVSNGRTLCIECHKKTPTFGGKLLKHSKEVKIVN